VRRTLTLPLPDSDDWGQLALPHPLTEGQWEYLQLNPASDKAQEIRDEITQLQALTAPKAKPPRIKPRPPSRKSPKSSSGQGCWSAGPANMKLQRLTISACL